MIGLILALAYLLVLVAVFAGFWKMFAKAGQPGWGCIIPIYNLYLLCKMAGRPWWWMILLFIPLVQMVIAVILSHDISKSFGRGIGTTIGLIVLPFIFYPILGFGSAEYQGPAGA